MTDHVAEQALLPFATMEHKAAAPAARPVPTRCVHAVRPSSSETALIMADPSRIALHPAFGGAEELLARRYEKDAAAIAAKLRDAGAQAPLTVSALDEGGSYILIGRPADLLAARIVRAEDPAFRIPVVVSRTAGPSDHYASMSASLRRPGDWERYRIASYHVEQAGSSRAAMQLLGLDPAKDESGFSRLLSIGKLLDTVPRLDPLTVLASSAARLMALRSDRRSRAAMDRLIEEATNGGTDLLDARKLLPRLITAVDPSTVPPEMVRAGSELDGWRFQRAGDAPLALIAVVNQVWSVQILQIMDATTWRTFSRAIAALMLAGKSGDARSVPATAQLDAVPLCGPEL